jgi:hypothetical protein
VVGNSLIGEGLDETAIEKNVTARVGRPIRAVKLTPDATNLYDWYCLLSRHADAALTADTELLIIGFAWKQLSDEDGPSFRMLGAYFADLPQLKVVHRIHPLSLDDFGEYTLSRLSNAWALKQPVRNRLLGAVVPYYKETQQILNQAPAEGEPADASGTFNYQLIAEFEQLLRATGRSAHFVAMPVMSDYVIDPSLVAMASASSRISFSDLQGAIPEQGRELYFEDPIHLNERGRTRLAAPFTQLIVQHLEANKRTAPSTESHL